MSEWSLLSRANCCVRPVIKKFALKGLLMFAAYKKLIKRKPDCKLLILNYHGVVNEIMSVPDWCFIGKDAFEKQIKYLKNNFNILPLSEAVDQLKGGKLNKPTVSITFDDGFQNNYDVAFPILKNLNIPATVFLTTGLVDSSSTVWFCKINKAIELTNKSKIHFCGEEYDISDLNSRRNVSALLQEKIKEFPAEIISKKVNKICDSLVGVCNGFAYLDEKFRMLDSKSIVKMKESGLVQFGAHTHSHFILSKLSNDKQLQEIEKSVKGVEALTGESCRMFAYPNGRKYDYNAFSLNVLLKYRVDIAATTVIGVNKKCTNPLELYRYGIGGDLSMEDFKLNVYYLINLK